MAGRNSADIVFCIDASGSMRPCIDAVVKNVEKLIEGLQTDDSTTWDVRFDFLTFHDSIDDGAEVHGYQSVNLPGGALVDSIYQKINSSKFFTRNLNEFRESLKQVECVGEEMHLLALDIAMDYPWRPSSECHRVVIMLTDEAVETGISVASQLVRIDRLIEKLMEKRVKLFIIAPESEAFYRLSCADRCEYMDFADASAGLRNVDFSKMLQTIGKSVSVTQSYDGGKTDPDPSYAQKEWVAVSDVTWSRDN